MKLSPALAAVLAALLVAAAVAFVLRPPQLGVHPAPASTTPPGLFQNAEPTPGIPLRLTPHPLVYVAGAVVHPGVYAVAPGARAADALAKAGGASADADLVAVNLAAPVADGEEVAVPRKGDPPPAAAPASQRRTAHSGRRRRRHPRRTAMPDGSGAPAAAPADPAGNGELVNINTAGEDQLSALPGIGPIIAERIVTFRDLNGPFESVDGLADVAGISPARLDELETLVTVGR